MGKSQAAFAALLGVSAESYRTWDAGRRATPPLVMVRARARVIATHRDDHALLPLPVLALLIGVHVKTLRAAARDGRLPVSFDTRTTFRLGAVGGAGRHEGAAPAPLTHHHRPRGSATRKTARVSEPAPDALTRCHEHISLDLRNGAFTTGC